MKLAPPSSTVANPDLSLSNGALVMYEHDGSPVIATILGFKKQNYQLLSMRGREVEMRPNRLLPLHTSLPPQIAETQKRAEFLLALYERCLKCSAEVNLEEILSLVAEEGADFTTEKLASLYYGKYSPEQFITLRLALMSDRIFFKRKGEEFSPRPPEIIEELKRNEAALARKLKIQESTIEFFAKRLKDPTLPIPSESFPILETLEEIAAGVTDFEHGRLKDAKDFLTTFCDRVRVELPQPKEKRALSLLYAIGHFNSETNLALIRRKIPVHFSETLLHAAAELKVPQAITEFPVEQQAIRKDLTNLNCITIDDQSTRDMDDALSVEQTHDGYRLGIHISDVSAVITPGSVLDDEARYRTTSLYLARTTVNMLPPELSESKCSLVAGEIRPAISFLFDVDPNFQIKGGHAVLSLVKVSKRMTYLDVSTALEQGDHDLSLLHSISATYESDRIEKGAMKVSKKEVLIYPAPEGEFILNEIDEDDPARTLVSELMVLGNALVSDFAVRNNLPMAFRSQEQPEEDRARTEIPPEGPAYDFFLRSRLKKSLVSQRPLPHATLGLPAYLQCTSPIRRYMDLVHQRQLVSFLVHGKPYYTAEELQEIMDDVEPRLADAGQANKETRRYWLLRYLQYLQSKKLPLSGIVVRLDGRTPLVELEKLYSTVFARLRTETKVGARVELKITLVDPEQDYLKLEQV